MEVNGPSVIVANIHTSSEAPNSMLAREQEGNMPVEHLAHLQSIGLCLITVESSNSDLNQFKLIIADFLLKTTGKVAHYPLTANKNVAYVTSWIL